MASKMEGITHLIVPMVSESHIQMKISYMYTTPWESILNFQRALTNSSNKCNSVRTEKVLSQQGLTRVICGTSKREKPFLDFGVVLLAPKSGSITEQQWHFTMDI